eukprot:1006261_1
MVKHAHHMMRVNIVAYPFNNPKYLVYSSVFSRHLKHSTINLATKKYKHNSFIMAESRHTGSIIHWNDRTGKGQIRLGSSNTHVTYTKSDITYGSVKVGDIVSFIKIKESRTGQFTARNVEKTQKSYSHNIANQNNPKRNSRKNMNQKPKGCLVFQTSWYNSTQFERIAAEYKSDYTSAPRFLFGDNNQDNHRRSSQSR